MITFDAEDDGKGDCFLMGFYDGNEYISFESKNYKTIIDFRQAQINFIINSGEKIFAAHNLEYDLSHIFQGEFLTVIDWYYSDSLIFAKLTGTSIKFIDSFHFSYCSLKQLGEEINTGKKYIDIKNIYEVYKLNPKKVLKYNLYDCKIVYDYMQRFTDTIENQFEVKIKNTLASTSQKIFLKNFCEHDIAGQNNNDELLKSYYGGRVECFYIGEINRPIFEMDVNSMYPYVMMNKKYPTTNFYESDKPYERNYIAEIQVTVKNVKIPIIPYRQNKLLFPTGNFKTFATSVEIDKALSENQIQEIHYIKVYNFPALDFVFKNFIDYFYKQRKNAKDRKNKFDSEYYKRIMNHLYGRFALHKELKKLTRITVKNYNKIIPVTDSAGYITLNMNDKSKNYALSLFVTSYARIYLYELLKKVSKHFDVIYCDTDSCYFTKLEYTPLMNMIDTIYKNFNIDNKLGNYSLECYESGIFYNVKAYLLNKYTDDKKIKLKGVKKEFREQFFKNDFVEYKKPKRMRSYLRSIQNVKVNEWELFSISRKGVYDKRVMIQIDKNLYKTAPLKME